MADWQDELDKLLIGDDGTVFEGEDEDDTDSE